MAHLSFLAVVPFLIGRGAAPPPLVAPSSSSVFVASVADDQNGAPLPDAEVSIPELSRSARTDWIGEAHFANVPRGEFRVEVRRLGYASAKLVVRFSTDTVGYVFMLDPVAHPLDTVTTKAKPAVPLRLQDYEWRRSMGIGRFLTDSVLLSERSRPIAEVMARRLVGLKSIHDDRSVAANRGAVDVYVDGVRLTGSRTLRGTSVPDAIDLRNVRADNVLGVEYYTAASAPAQFRRPGMGSGGVVLIWLRD